MFRKIAAFLLSLCLLTGCAGSPEDKKTAGEITFTDDLGRIISVDKPQRTAALLGSFAQIWMLAGGEVCATADDAWDDLGLELREDTVNLGSIKELSLEMLLSSEPDFILASANTRQHMEWKDVLEATGIPVAYFNVADFNDYLRLLEICTRITGRQDLFEANGLAVQEQIKKVLERSAQWDAAPTVLCLRASASLITVKNSEDNVLGEMLRALGCVNIADSEASLLENLSIERILEMDPEYIFVVQRGDDREGMIANVESMMAESPAWQQLTAVKTGKMYYMDKNLYNLKPNHRWGEAYEQLEALISNG